VNLRPKSQHYVPIFYLKNWRDRDDKLWVYERTPEGIAESRAYPDETGCQDWLYSFGREVPWEIAVDPDVIETTHFKKIDNKAAKIAHILVKRKQRMLSKTQKKSWAKFIISLLVRNLRVLRTNDQVAHSSAIALIESLKATSGDPKLWDRCFDGIDFREMARGEVRRQLIEFITSRMVRDALCEQNFLTYGYDEDALIASDEPVRINFGAGGQVIQTLALALDPRHLFMVVPKGSGKGITSSEHGVRFAQAYVDATLCSQAKYIYSHRCVGEWFPLLRAGIDKYFGTGEDHGFTTLSASFP
jgi:hypothetical protein